MGVSILNFVHSCVPVLIDCKSLDLTPSNWSNRRHRSIPLSDLIEHDRIKKDIDDYGTKKIKEGATKATKTNESAASIVLKHLYEKNSKDCIRAGNAFEFFESLGFKLMN